jgi:undecaprenyl-diphosphatase
MYDYLLSVFLGVVEGVTEFLPVSSTAHLRICEALLHIDLHDGFWKMYTIVIQLGAILALPVYFRHRILKFVSTFPKGERGDRTILTHPLSLTLIAFVVTAVPAWALAKVIGKNLESLWVMALALLIGGIVMWIVDATFTRPRTMHMEEMSLPQAVWIGAAQILSAVFPGTSRSMSTIAAGQIAGMSRPAALEFSFFLSMPTMAAATGSMDRAGNWVRRFILCGAGGRRMVHELGALSRICAICDLPNCARSRIVDAVDAWNDVTRRQWRATLFFLTCKAR